MRSEQGLGKNERQKLITSIVSRRRVGTQHELMDALVRAGCRVTQATISRDIRELGLDKAHDVLGRPRYVAPPWSRPPPARHRGRSKGVFAASTQPYREGAAAKRWTEALAYLFLLYA